jgi:hypothetical protein
MTIGVTRMDNRNGDICRESKQLDEIENEKKGKSENDRNVREYEKKDESGD